MRVRTRGAGLLDALIAIFLLGFAGVVFATTFPTAHTGLRQASDSSHAARICRQKIEQVRDNGFDGASAAELAGAGIIDPGQTTQPYSFTIVDQLASAMPSGTGELTISNESSGLVRLVVTVEWEGQNGSPRSVSTATLMADKSTLVRAPGW